MARPRQVSDADILAVARDVFVEHGPSASTQRIADAVGLSQPALFKRFGTKRELMRRALLPPADFAFVDSVFPEPSQTHSGREVLRQLIVKLVGHFMHFAPGLAALHATGASPQEIFGAYPEPPPVALRKRLIVWLTAGREAGLFRDAPYDSLSLALMGGIQGRVMLQQMVDIAIPDSYTDDLVDLFWARLAPDKESA